MRYFEKIPSVHTYSNKSTPKSNKFIQIRVIKCARGSKGLRHSADIYPSPQSGTSRNNTIRTEKVHETDHTEANLRIS